MHIRIAVLAVLCAATYGCATPAAEPKAAASTASPAPEAASQSRPSGSYRTGSRLPQYDSDGSSSTGSASKDDYMDDANRRVSPTFGR
jgi:hypothetical protein